MITPKFWKDEIHKETFSKFLVKFGSQNKDHSTITALYVLSGIDYQDRTIADFISDGLIRFTDLLEESAKWSTSEKTLLKTAAHFFNPGNFDISLHGAFHHLDLANTRLIMEAITFRYGPSREKTTLGRPQKA